MPAAPQTDLRLTLSDAKVRELAEQFGTPLYVLDEQHFRERIRRYKSAFHAAWRQSELVFASKANSTLAILAIAHEEGCLLDVASEGELRAALGAGVPAEKCHLHGNFKSDSELKFAMESGVSEIVVDNFTEIERIFAFRQSGLRCPDVVLRLAPGVDPITHQKISTGQVDTKFGFNIANGAAARALNLCQGLNLPVVGFHCHVGSQLLDPEAQRAGGELIAGFAVDMLRNHGFWTKVLNIGGGLGVRYTDEDEPTPIESYCRMVVDAVRTPMESSGLQPTLMQEPGRALIAESGVTIYRIGPVKTVPSPSKGERTYVAVDGGLSDNPRPAMYGAQYTVRHTPATEADGEDSESVLVPYTVSGKHCESDTLFEDALLPIGLQEGDLIQVLCTGAYGSSMASNYNRFPRPATVLLAQKGESKVVQRRETWEEMFARESIAGGQPE